MLPLKIFLPDNIISLDRVYSMRIEELTQKAKTFIKESSYNDRVQLLLDAKIIGKDGYFHPGYFSQETITKNKAENKPITFQQ